MTVSMRFICVTDAAECKQVEVLSESASDAVTSSQLRNFAAMVRGEPVKTATLRTWRNRIGIHADAEGYYTLDDMQLLGRYLEALAAGRTTAQFLNQEYGHAEQRPA